MCPYPYYTVMREVTAPKHLCLRMVLYAKTHGIKPAARVFATTVKTIRKWLRRVALKKKVSSWAAKRLKDQFDLP